MDKAKTSLAYTVYDHIKEQIISGRWEPGKIITEQEVAGALDISRTPVREALKLLQADGLVSVTPYRRARVVKLTLQDVREISQVRAALEGMAAYLAAPGMTREVLQVLRSAFEDARARLREGDPVPATRAGERLHAAIWEASGNNRLRTMLAQANIAISLTGLLARAVPGRIESALNEHLRILEALEAHDATAARDRMLEHVHNVYLALIDRM